MLITCVAPFNLVCITIENHSSLSSNWGTLCVTYFNKSYPDIILLRGSLSWTLTLSDLLVKYFLLPTNQIRNVESCF